MRAVSRRCIRFGKLVLFFRAQLYRSERNQVVGQITEESREEGTQPSVR